MISKCAPIVALKYCFYELDMGNSSLLSSRTDASSVPENKELEFHGVLVASVLWETSPMGLVSQLKSRTECSLAFLCLGAVVPPFAKTQTRNFVVGVGFSSLLFFSLWKTCWFFKENTFPTLVLGQCGKSILFKNGLIMFSILARNWIYEFRIQCENAVRDIFFCQCLLGSIMNGFAKLIKVTHWL